MDARIWLTGEGGEPRSVALSAERTVLGDPIAVGPSPGAVAVGTDAVWVANNGDGSVTRIEP